MGVRKLEMHNFFPYFTLKIHEGKSTLVLKVGIKH